MFCICISRRDFFFQKLKSSRARDRRSQIAATLLLEYTRLTISITRSAWLGSFYHCTSLALKGDTNASILDGVKIVQKK
jgi:hypothetical protein